MFSTNPNYTKLKTHLRLSINRLKLLEKKKTELAQKARKEVAEYIAAGKSERAKIRVEHIIRSVKVAKTLNLVVKGRIMLKKKYHYFGLGYYQIAYDVFGKAN